MATAAAVLQTIHTDEWNAEVYGALASVSNIAIYVRKKANVIRLAYHLHQINRRLQPLFEKIHDTAEGKIPPPQVEPVTEERVKEVLGDLMRLYRGIETVYASLRSVGLQNNSLASGPLRRFRSYGDQLLDLVDWLETSFNTQETSAIFDRAQAERDRGEIYDLEQVQ